MASTDMAWRQNSRCICRNNPESSFVTRFFDFPNFNCRRWQVPEIRTKQNQKRLTSVFFCATCYAMSPKGRHAASHKTSHLHASEIPTECWVRTELFFLGRIKGLAQARTQSRGKGAHGISLLCPLHHLINLDGGRVGNCDSEICDGGMASGEVGKGSGSRKFRVGFKKIRL